MILTDNQDEETFFNELSSKLPGNPMCCNLLLKRDIIYRCFDCGKSDSSCFCKKCFDLEKHKVWSAHPHLLPLESSLHLLPKRRLRFLWLRKRRSHQARGILWGAQSCQSCCPARIIYGRRVCFGTSWNDWWPLGLERGSPMSIRLLFCSSICSSSWKPKPYVRSQDTQVFSQRTCWFSSSWRRRRLTKPQDDW